MRILLVSGSFDDRKCFLFGSSPFLQEFYTPAPRDIHKKMLTLLCRSMQRLSVAATSPLLQQRGGGMLTGSLCHLRLRATQSIPRRSFAFANASFQRKQRDRKPIRALQSEVIRNEAGTRWLPCAKGNLKRQRSGDSKFQTSKSQRQQSRTARPAYATRSQLRKLKKILPQSFSMRRRNFSYIPVEKNMHKN